jgi:hypothetical protein
MNKNRPKTVEQIEGKYIHGWPEFLRAQERKVTDSKGRLRKTDVLPPKIVIRLMVELEDGSCVPVHGEHFVPMETEVKGAFKAAFVPTMKEAGKIPGKTYKKGQTVKIKKTTFQDNGWVEYDEID